MHASFAPNQMVRTRTLGKFVSLLFAIHYWRKLGVLQLSMLSGYLFKHWDTPFSVVAR